MRAVAIHITGKSWPSARLSVRSQERIDQALRALQRPGMPIVYSADDSVCGAILAAWSVADYCVVRQHLHAVRCGSTNERAAHPKERARQFAGWLAHHPAIGLKHMLRLTRRVPAPRPLGALLDDSAARTLMLYGSCTRSETSLLLAQRSAPAETFVVPATDPPPLSEIRMPSIGSFISIGDIALDSCAKD